jgi:hypothetical protein
MLWQQVYVVVVLVSCDVQIYVHQWIEMATTTKPKALLDEVFAVLDLL